MSHEHNSDAFKRGRLDLELGRRQLLQAGALGVAVSVAAGTAAPAAAATTAKRAYVIVLDGTRPEELDLGITPNLTKLRDEGRRYPRAQSMPIMETIPNHVMMMTGVRPEFSGVPANKVWDGSVLREMDRSTDILRPTVIEQLNDAGYLTSTVLSKEYLYGVFHGKAGMQWEPFPVIPVSGHAPDAATVQQAVSIVNGPDPHFMFVNLGDIDRVGHSDLTTILTGSVTSGGSLPAARRAALTDTDTQVGQLVKAIKDKGHWDNSLLVFLADHSMDWSSTEDAISLTSTINTVAAGKFQIAENGGADLIYWTGPASERAAGVAAIRDKVRGVKGVLEVHTPAELGLGPMAGDLVVYAKAGYRLSETPTSNPIPGNHGHPTTKPIPFFLSGGAARPGVFSHSVKTLDVAPTIGEFFGIAPPPQGWQGRSRL